MKERERRYSEKELINIIEENQTRIWDAYKIIESLRREIADWQDKLYQAAERKRWAENELDKLKGKQKCA